MGDASSKVAVNNWISENSSYPGILLIFMVCLTTWVFRPTRDEYRDLWKGWVIFAVSQAVVMLPVQIMGLTNILPTHLGEVWGFRYSSLLWAAYFLCVRALQRKLDKLFSVKRPTPNE